MKALIAVSLLLLSSQAVSAAESWILWKKTNVIEFFGRQKDVTKVESISVFESKAVCLEKAKDYALGESGKRFNASDGVSEMGNGQGYTFTTATSDAAMRVTKTWFQCWPVGVNPQ